MSALPQPPTSDQITLQWLMENKSTLAQYMARVKAMENMEVVVMQNGEMVGRVGVDWSNVNGVLRVEI